MISTAIATVSAFSLAAYIQNADLDQTVSVANRTGIYIALDSQDEWSSDGAIIKMYVWNSSDNSIPKKYLSPIGTTASGYQIFNFQTIYNRIVFLRCNPSADPSYFADDTGSAFATAFISGVAWNKTYDFTYNTDFTSTKRLCTITDLYNNDTAFIGTDSNRLGTISAAIWSTLS